MQNLNSSKIKYFSSFGYEKFGPLLLLFCNWLLKEVKAKKIKKVYFLARDGYIMKKAFDLINVNNDIKTEYFYASRRSIIVPSLWKLNDYDEIFNVIAFNKNITIKAFLKKVGLEDEKKIDSYLKQFDYEINTEIEMKNNFKFNKFVKDIFPLIQKNSKEEWYSFQKYINAKDFKTKVAIVDIGWFGSMQSALNNLVEDTEIYGYYFGLIPDKKICLNNSYGFLFDTSKNIDIYKKFHYFINIFEFLFLAQHGSVKKFINNSNYIELYDYEYQNMEEETIAKIIQDNALKYISNNKNQKLNYEATIKEFTNIFLYPSIKTAKYFGNIKFKDDETKFIAKPEKFIKYLVNINKLKKDFTNSAWRIGFMKRIFLIPMPYYKMNNIIRKKLNKE